MHKFQIDLDNATFDALATMAIEELRQVQQQAAWLIIQAMRVRTGRVPLLVGTRPAEEQAPAFPLTCHVPYVGKSDHGPS